MGGDASKRIVFIDLTTPKPYDSQSLESEPLGGTEATVIRVAEGLAGRGHDVIVAQHNKTSLTSGAGKANYTSIEALEAIKRTPAAVVVLRSTVGLPFARNRFGEDTKLFLWSHDFCEQDYVVDYALISACRTKILAVSSCHKTAITSAMLTQLRNVKGVTVDYVYNPIADSLSPDETPVDLDKLVYFSSPHKGLQNTLYMFNQLRTLYPEYKLLIANPGYYPDQEANMEGVTNLGSLPHAEILQHVRSAFCVFHMNRYPETFGLVYAEALAVGTPVITGFAGAVPEIVQDREYMVNVDSEKAVIERIEKWRKNGRPETKLREDVRMTKVLDKWEALIR